MPRPTKKGECKVERVTRKYNIENINDDLIRLRGEESASLRDLEDYMNKRILEAAIESSTLDTTKYDIEHIFNILTEDEPELEELRNVERKLIRNDIDPDEIESSFLTYNTIRNHFHECLGKNTSVNNEPSFEKNVQTLTSLYSRTEIVFNDSLKRLHEYDMLKMGEPDIYIEINVECGKCGNVHDAFELLKAGGCECSLSDSEEDVIDNIETTNTQNTTQTNISEM